MSVNAGGAFLPSANYSPTGTWDWSGAASITWGASQSGTFTLTNTLTAATYAASTHQDELFVNTTLTPVTTVTAANGLNSIRGGMTLTAGKTLGSGSASYVTAVYGRGDIHGTVNIGSGDLAAIYGKFDLSSSTLTSGHIAPVQSNIVNPGATAAATTDLFYGESASGTSIKSILSGYATAAYAFDLTDVSNAFINLTGTCTTPGQSHGWIRVLLNGNVRYIVLSAAVS
jgi:hypothetical protein